MDTIQLRRDTYNNWSASNPTLAEGEMGLIKNTNPLQFKVGNGTSSWNALPLQSTGGGDSKIIIDLYSYIPSGHTSSSWSGSISEATFNDLAEKVWSGKPLYLLCDKDDGLIKYGQPNEVMVAFSEENPSQIVAIEAINVVNNNLLYGLYTEPDDGIPYELKVFVMSIPE